MKYGVIWLAVIIGLSGCVNQTRIQRKYVSEQGECQSTAENNIDTFTAGRQMTDKDRNNELVNLFGACMSGKGWTVATPKDPPINTGLPPIIAARTAPGAAGAPSGATGAAAGTVVARPPVAAPAGTMLPPSTMVRPMPAGAAAGAAAPSAPVVAPMVAPSRPAAAAPKSAPVVVPAPVQKSSSRRSAPAVITAPDSDFDEPVGLGSYRPN